MPNPDQENVAGELHTFVFNRAQVSAASLSCDLPAAPAGQAWIIERAYTRCSGSAGAVTGYTVTVTDATSGQLIGGESSTGGTSQPHLIGPLVAQPGEGVNITFAVTGLTTPVIVGTVLARLRTI